MTDQEEPAPGPLAGLRVLDMSRILAAPTMTQVLGDLGADIIKIERPGKGDDTRQWGPPFLKAANADEPGWSSYFLSANRNKRSLALDIAHPKGQQIIRELTRHCDIFIENFKVGGLAKYGLGFDDLVKERQDLIYCSVTGFGQTGPMAPRAGYDAMVQGMGGVMSITGEADGDPMKVGVGISDIMTGMYAGMAILSALHHREKTGEGQYIDVALFDTQLAWLVNAGMNYLLTNEAPRRYGTAHPNIVPYQVFPASDGFFMLAVGNDAQFRRFCELAGAPELAGDPRFATNPARLENRVALIDQLRGITAGKSRDFWLTGLERANVPSGPINDVAQAFDEPQTKARGMRVKFEDERIEGGKADLIGSPLKLSMTQVSYRQFPPSLGEHTREILEELLGMKSEDIDALDDEDVIETGRKAEKADD